jgi:thioredoxin-dependent peroxiredoxin
VNAPANPAAPRIASFAPHTLTVFFGPRILILSMLRRINDTAPDFTAETTQGTIHFHEWIGDGWAVLFSHPKDFTPVCTTELGYMAGLQPEFAKRNTKIIGLSVDPVTNHGKWAADIEETQGHKVNYPMIGDTELKIAKLYNMLPAESGHTSEGRTAADNATVRTVFVIGPDKKIKLMLIYPMSTGRNFDEVLRVLDSMQLTAKHKVATPVNWKQGGDVIILPSVSNDEAQQKYPGGWKSPKPYLRIVAGLLEPLLRLQMGQSKFARCSSSAPMEGVPSCANAPG